MIKFAKVISSNTDLLTAQAFVFSRENSADLTQPAIYLAMVVSATGEDIFAKVRQISLDLEESFFETDQPIASRMAQAIDVYKTKLSDAENLQILLASWKEGTIYIQSLGGHKAYLIRDTNISDLTEIDPGGQLISGYIKEHDRLLFLSSRIIDQTDLQIQKDSWEESLITRLIKTPLDDLDEELAQFIQQTNHRDPVATILLENLAKSSERLPDESFASSTPPPTVSGFDQPLQEVKRSIQIPMLNLRTLRLLIKKVLPHSFVGMLIASALLGVLILVIFTTVSRARKNSQTSSQFNILLIRARDEYNQAQGLKDLSPDQAKQKLADSRADLAKALSLKSKDSQALDLKKQLDQNSNEILKIFPVSDWPVFLDLELIKPGFKATKMSISINQVLLLDENQKTLVQLDLKKKSNQILAGSNQLGQPQFATINGELAFVYSKDKGLLKIDTQSLKVTVAAKPDPEWGQISDIYGFGTNIYLLDSFKNQIWKYVPIASGYSDKFEYLKGKADLAGTKRLQIDSSVWVLKSGPDITKYTQGVADNFSLSGLDKPLGQTNTFYVADDTDSAYFMDMDNSRLVVTKKDGQYLSEYQGDKFKTATDLIVDEKSKKIYLLEGSKIYQIDLK